MQIILPQGGILQGIPQPLSQFQPHCEVTFFWLQLKIGLFNLLYLTSYIKNKED